MNEYSGYGYKQNGLIFGASVRAKNINLDVFDYDVIFQL